MSHSGTVATSGGGSGSSRKEPSSLSPAAALAPAEAEADPPPTTATTTTTRQQLKPPPNTKRSIVLNPFRLKRDLDEDVQSREGGNTFISTMGKDRVFPRRMTARGSVKAWLRGAGLQRLSRALGPSLEDQVHLSTDDFVRSAEPGDVVLVQRKRLFEHRHVPSDVLRGVVGTVSHHFLPKRAFVEPWTDVALVVEVAPGAAPERVKCVVTTDDGGAILVRALEDLVLEAHADSSTCALRRLSTLMPPPDLAGAVHSSSCSSSSSSGGRTPTNRHPSRVAVGAEDKQALSEAKLHSSVEPTTSPRGAVMQRLCSFVQAVIDARVRAEQLLHTQSSGASHARHRLSELPIAITYHDLMRASSVASCAPCRSAFEAAARRVLRISKYPSIDDVNNLVQIFFTIDRDQLGSIPIGIVREFVDPTMRAGKGLSGGGEAAAAAAAGGSGGALGSSRSKEEIEQRLRDMDVNGDGVISLDEFIHAFFQEVRDAADAPVAAGSSLAPRGSAVGDLRGVLQAEFVAALLVQAGCLELRRGGAYSVRGGTSAVPTVRANVALVDGAGNHTRATGADASFSSYYVGMSDYFLPSSFSSQGPVSRISDVVAASVSRRRQNLALSHKDSTLRSLTRMASGSLKRVTAVGGASSSSNSSSGSASHSPASVAPSEDSRDRDSRRGGAEAKEAESVLLPSPVRVLNDCAPALHGHASSSSSSSATSTGAGERGGEFVAVTDPALAFEPEVFLVHQDVNKWF